MINVEQPVSVDRLKIELALLDQRHEEGEIELAEEVPIVLHGLLVHGPGRSCFHRMTE